MKYICVLYHYLHIFMHSKPFDEAKQLMFDSCNLVDIAKFFILNFRYELKFYSFTQ